MEKGCSAADVAVALDLPRNGGADLKRFVAGLDATTIANAGQDTMAAIVVAAAAEGTGGDQGGEAAPCPGRSNNAAVLCVLRCSHAAPDGAPAVT